MQGGSKTRVCCCRCCCDETWNVFFLLMIDFCIQARKCKDRQSHSKTHTVCIRDDSPDNDITRETKEMNCLKEGPFLSRGREEGVVIIGVER